MSENTTTCPDAPSCENDICKTANYIWMIISPVLLAFGLIGGLLISIVLIRIRFQTTPLLFFLFTLAITDMVILCVGLLRLWVLETWQIDIRDLSNAGCKLLHFFVYFSMQFSSWILVCVTVERFIKCRYMTYTSMVTVKKCMTSLLVIFVVLGSLNSHYFWTHGFVLSKYNTTVCGVLPEYETFDECIVYTLQYSNYAVSYIFYTVYDKRIRRQLKQIIRATKPRFRSHGSQYTMDSCSTEIHTVSSSVSIKSVSQK
uniref:G-protein coupled receptors family 1 profile domain-containing protein n=1 Tax=Magallana gigas TaxID=29159 RepID=A0A8W8LBY3_MAGGI